MVIQHGHRPEAGPLVPAHLGHPWGRKEVAIPITAVTRVDIGIRINLTKDQVRNLPTR